MKRSYPMGVLGALELSFLLMLASTGCESTRNGGSKPNPENDSHVREGGQDLFDNPEILSPPILDDPIYECTKGVLVKGFVPGALVEIFIEGDPNPIGGGISQLSWGQPFTVNHDFRAGDNVFARQTFNGRTSSPSNRVRVTSYRDDFPLGPPKPRIHPGPLHECGRALGYAEVLPGAHLRVFSEGPRPGGGFDAPVEIASDANAQPDFGYLTFSPGFIRGARITIRYRICTDDGPVSEPLIVQPEPSSLGLPTVDPVYENQTVVTVRGPGGTPNNPVNGAVLDVFADNQPPGSERVGGQPTPGGAGQQVLISPSVRLPVNYWAEQSLCSRSGPGPRTPGRPCSELPPAKIRPPTPGDTYVEVTEYIPGSRILVFVNGNKAGDGGAPQVNLVDAAGNPRPINDNDEIIVVQRLGDCQSRWIYVIRANCSEEGAQLNCSGDWPAFRQNTLRDGQQRRVSDLADPRKVRRLRVRRTFVPPQPPRGFRASPIVDGERVYIGNGNGYFYCLDSRTLALLWQFPAADQPPLTSQFECNPSSFGISASATLVELDRNRFVIFGAPDQRVGRRLGSGRLFALRASNLGGILWESPEVAVLNGTSMPPAQESFSELHEQMGYSSPLAFDDRVFVGIANHCDNPIQNGRVAAVHLASGVLDGSFTFKATSTRGGGIWSSVAGGFGENLFVTTGNVASGNTSEPSVNHALALLKLDANTGSVLWKLQPVPYALDGDPDWASGATLSQNGCGQTVVSTMKDGWSYAVNAQTGGVLWQFPPTGFPFVPGDGTAHGDTRYLVPGAAWNGVFFTMTGGADVVNNTLGGLHRLHALNICESNSQRVRWVLDLPGVPPVVSDQGYRMGPPTVTRGIVFVGTHQGHLVAIADPSVWPAAGSRCSNPNVSDGDCVSSGYSLVPTPSVLLDLDLGGGSILTEPVLAHGRVYVATSNGTLFMLEPEP